MYKLNLDPLSPFKGNLISYEDMISGDQYEQHTAKIRERFKYNAANNVFGHMTKMKASVYVFSKEELEKIIKSGGKC